MFTNLGITDHLHIIRRATSVVCYYASHFKAVFSVGYNFAQLYPCILVFGSNTQLIQG